MTPTGAHKQDKPKGLSRDEVLLWLNDHCGSVVHINVVVERGDLGAAVFSSSGLLHPKGAPSGELFWQGRRSHVGLYRVGEEAASLDLTELPADAQAWKRQLLEVEEIGLEFAENVWLRVGEVRESEQD